MSLIATAVHSAHLAAMNLSTVFLSETETEFNADKVTPGPEGFIMTAVFAAAVLVLGFLLVRRIRRSQYRAEARENIAAEIASNDEQSTGGDAIGNDGSPRDDNA
ncbi:MAG: hypothetical protein ACTIJ6_05155 [Leucobacter sp.]